MMEKAREGLQELNRTMARALRREVEEPRKYVKRLRLARPSRRGYLEVLHEYARFLARAHKFRSAARAYRVAIELGLSLTPSVCIDEFALEYLALFRILPKSELREDIDTLELRMNSQNAALFRYQLLALRGRLPEAQIAAKAAVEQLSVNGPGPALWTALVDLADMQMEDGNISEARETGLRALDITERALVEVPFHARRNLLTALRGSTDFLVRLHIKSGELQSPRLVDIVDASKARSLLEALAEDVMPVAGDLPEALRLEERQLVGQLRFAKRYRHAAPDIREAQPGPMEGEARKELRRFLDKMPVEYSAYARLRSGKPQSVATSIRALGDAHPNTYTCLFYCLDEGICRWLIDNNGSVRSCEFQVISKADLKEKTDTFLAYCSTRNSVIDGLGESLHRLIFGSMLDLVPPDSTLLIIPSASLHTVPFSALVKNRKYLLELYKISILPCISLIPYFRIPWNTPGRLVLGNSCEDLEGAEREAIAVAKLLNTAPLLRNEVVRASLQTINQCYFVHVACHGLSDRSIPGYSGFLLADRTILSVNELAEMQMRCRLAVLSACKTGAMEFDSEDDPITIGIGFMRAGAACVIFSLWEIDDVASGELAILFYKRMLLGYSLNSSLREAQLGMLRRASFSHPYFWAALQLMGDWAPAKSHQGRMHFD
jgi:hypothetical protein